MGNSGISTSTTLTTSIAITNKNNRVVRNRDTSGSTTYGLASHKKGEGMMVLNVCCSCMCIYIYICVSR